MLPLHQTTTYITVSAIHVQIHSHVPSSGHLYTLAAGKLYCVMIKEHVRVNKLPRDVTWSVLNIVLLLLILILILILIHGAIYWCCHHCVSSPSLFHNAEQCRLSDQDTVHRLVCVCLCVFCVFLFHTAYVLYYCECVGMDLVGLKPNL